jgi:hypothetical protein
MHRAAHLEQPIHLRHLQHEVARAREVARAMPHPNNAQHPPLPARKLKHELALPFILRLEDRQRLTFV